MKKLYLIGMLLCCVLCVNAQWNQKASRNVITQTRSVGTFTGIEAGGAFNIIIQEGPAGSIQIEASDNVVPQITSEVVRDVLVLHLNGNFKNIEKLEIKISMNELKVIKLSGAATATFAGNYKTEGAFKMDLSGASKIPELNISANMIDVEVSGASKTKIVSKSSNLDIDCSGASKIEISSVVSNKIKCELSGASKLDANFQAATLNIDASGASKANLSGNWNSQKLTASGASNIKNSGLVEQSEVKTSGAGSISN